MRVLTMIAVLFTMLCFSCRKDDNGVIGGKLKEDFMMLKVGNYWVYERYLVQDDTLESFNGLDSIYVEKDTLLNGRHYYVLMITEDSKNPTVYKLLRDSSTYTLSYPGRIVFSYTDFANTFDTLYMGGGDTIATIVTSMTDKGFAGYYPAGIFETHTFRETFYMHPPYDVIASVRYRDTKYAKNVGMVYENTGFYAFANFYYHRKLLRYKVN